MAHAVTVIMPVYNGGQHLKEAIESILAQTYKDFELLIIDDGSKDNSVKIIEAYADSRIHLIKNEDNIGLLKTLNKALDLTETKYVARMDQDDISHAERLEMQFRFMEKNPQVGICGSWIEVFGLGNYIHQYATEYDDVKAELFFENALAHPTVFMRTALLNKFNLRYETSFFHIDDYDLWCRAARCFPICNLPQALLSYRTSEASYCRVFSKEQKMALRRLDERSLLELQLEATSMRLDAMQNLRDAACVSSALELRECLKLCKDVIEMNRKRQLYPQKAFEQKVGVVWRRLCRSNTSLGVSTYLLHAEFGGKIRWGKEHARFVLQCLLAAIKRLIKRWNNG